MDQEPGSASLQELSTEATLHELLKQSSSAATTVFNSVPPLQQARLFSHLLQRHKICEGDLNILKEKVSRVPDADCHVFFGPPGRLGLSGELYEPFDMATALGDVWRYATAGDIERFQSEERQRAFNNRPSHKESRGRDPMDLVSMGDGEAVNFVPYDEQRARWKDENGEEQRPRRLHELISSQLLLYRLVVTFGPPPVEQRLDGYQCGWEVHLVLKEEEEPAGVPDKEASKSYITFCDYKGSAHCDFVGTNDAEERVLELINYLIGENCAHSYDRVLAGRRA